MRGRGVESVFTHYFYLSINEESGQSSNDVSREMYVRGKCKNKSRRNGNEKCKLERIIH